MRASTTRIFSSNSADSASAGLFDGAARALFALWQAYALGHGATRLLWLFLVTEVAFGAVQPWPWRCTRRTGPVSCRHLP